jgi:hypothetical protein
MGKSGVEKGKQERISQTGNGQEFETSLPTEKSWTLKSEFRFVEA